MKKVIKNKKFNKLLDPIYMSFFACMLALTGTTLITAMAAFSSQVEVVQNTYIQNALISETCVNVIAGVTYYYFLIYLYQDKLTLKEVTSIRYIDWMLTTPFLLYSFTLYLTWENNRTSPVSQNYNFLPLVYIIPLNIAMLICGFLGETGRINKTAGLLIGFGFFTGLMYCVYDEYVKDKSNEDDLKIYFWIFTGVWLLYGVSYIFDTRLKNISYNILDGISKVGFGIFLWMSMTHSSGSVVTGRGI